MEWRGAGGGGGGGGTALAAGWSAGAASLEADPVPAVDATSRPARPVATRGVFYRLPTDRPTSCVPTPPRLTLPAIHAGTDPPHLALAGPPDRIRDICPRNISPRNPER